MRLFLSILISLLHLSLLAQTSAAGTGTIKGKVLDDNKAPISYASVSVLNEGGELLLGAISDDKGKFELTDVPQGSFVVDIQFLGYASWQQSVQIDAARDNINLGTITLTADQQVLDEVVVTAEKSQYSLRLDRKVFEVGKDVQVEGSNALDILDQVPQVTVDPTGAVTLRGNGNVQILINGRRSGLTLNNAIEQIAGENIERIEVVTNPSAAFDANGSAGIINIILKKNQALGFKGQVSATVGTPANHMLLPGFTYRSNKINLFGNYRWRYSDYNGRYTSDQIDRNTDINVLSKREREDRHDDGQSFYIGGDYFINDKNTFTLAFFRADTKDTDYTALDYTLRDEQDIATPLLREANTLEKRDYNQLEANFTRTYDREGQRLSIDLQYDFWNSRKTWDLATEANDLGLFAEEQLRTLNESGSRDFVLQVDYRQPLGEKTKLNFGGKVENRIVTTNYIAEFEGENGWATFRNIDNDVDYGEMIAAGYVQYEQQIGKLEYQVGLRTEFTEIDIDDVENTFGEIKDYLNLFPSAFLSYPLGEASTIQASYSRRINRPNLWNLYPFFELRDINIFSAGNPNLNPSFTNGFEVTSSHSFDKFSINPGIYHRRTQDPFQYFLQRDDEGIFVNTPVNVDQENETGVEVSLKYQPARFLRLTGDANYFQFKTTGEFDGQNLDAEGTTWRFRTMANIRLPKDLGIQVRYRYRAPRKEAQVEYFSSSDLTVGISKSFFDDKLSISLRGMNLLNSQVRESRAVTDDFVLLRSGRRIRERFSATFVYKINQTERDRMRYAKRGNR